MLAPTPAGIVFCRNTVSIGVADGRVEEAGGGGGAVVAVTNKAPHRVTVTVVSPLCRVKLTPCKPPAVVDDIAANLGLLLAAVAVTEVASTAPTVSTKSGLPYVLIRQPTKTVLCLNEMTNIPDFLIKFSLCGLCACA